jgi:hypothetical protein
MKARRRVLEAELKTVQVIRLSTDPELARAAGEREKELCAELRRLEMAEESTPAPSAEKR